MKLLHKTTLYLLLAAIPIALGGVFLLNAYIHLDMLHEIDELLASELIQVKAQLRQHPPSSADLPGWDPNIRIRRTSSILQPAITYTDTVAFTPGQHEKELVRMLRTTYAVGNQTYVISLQQSYLEFDEIASAVSVGAIVCFLIVVTLLVLADVLVTRRIWQPFYGIIRQLQQYRVDGPEEAAFPSSDVHEFKLLAQSLDEMSRRTRHQYAQQKQFTDNASHEMQTPLSVLSVELDLLQQSAGLDETDLNRIQRSQQEINRLSAMNKSLLLLAKIDNHQFAQNDSVNIGELVNQLVENYSDYVAHRGIMINRMIKEGPCRNMNRQLADVLFSNLIKNAIRHGDVGSSIFIQVGNNSFIITNEGDPLPFPQDQLFLRFVRNQALPQSTGLGLALVKEIAGQYGMTVKYDYASSMRRHMFQVDF
ncbi:MULTISPECIES: HAMP domain-containing sensor histidine kinase [unclassified Spirosoma]|uniref:sensor histidine kinase n=1 Tax=unclassified Spirosoma TaxID=2621999 RepID=UPI0009687B7B|nr:MULTISPECIES: HAMP domain-containing sensor histidine kinase [unclassified Spirosoma]MBN8826614.1 HAMP domain-containing histidine kinase [Spirosoma sp.]OJW70292.1 MAG: two-component sensor histidine kinase [Spirosoma sp. 48-14]